MNLIIKQLYPSKGAKPQEALCTTPEDIYNIPFVDRWMQDPDFYKLCKSTHKDSPNLLICETHGGRSFWVIASIQGDIEELLMPEWQKQR